MLTGAISQCLDNVNVPVIKYNFVELKDLETVAKDSICGKFGHIWDVWMSLMRQFTQM